MEDLWPIKMFLMVVGIWALIAAVVVKIGKTAVRWGIDEADRRRGEHAPRRRGLFGPPSAPPAPNPPCAPGTSGIWCENCGERIGRLEPAYVHDGKHIVCGECNRKLKT